MQRLHCAPAHRCHACLRHQKKEKKITLRLRKEKYDFGPEAASKKDQLTAIADWEHARTGVHDMGKDDGGAFVREPMERQQLPALHRFGASQGQALCGLAWSSSLRHSRQESTNCTVAYTAVKVGKKEGPRTF